MGRGRVGQTHDGRACYDSGAFKMPRTSMGPSNRRRQHLVDTLVGGGARLLLVASCVCFSSATMAEAAGSEADAAAGRPPREGSIAAAGSKGAALEPAPYDRVVDAVEWTSQEGRRLTFCLLGYRNEDRARAIAVFEWADHRWTRLFADGDRGFSPWKLALAELDGDALPEVVVGTHNVARFDPVRRNRLFVFDWTRRETLFAKWLGSRLCGPFDDFTLVRGGDGRDRLLAVESAGGEGRVIREYRWNGFGFTLERDWMSRSQDEKPGQPEENVTDIVRGPVAQEVSP
jgi:hypothetical protein